MEGLFNEFRREIFRQDLGEAGDVVDIFLGIEGGELSAKHVEGVDQLDRHSPKAGVEGREKACGAGANDRKIDGGLWGWFGHDLDDCKLEELETPRLFGAWDRGGNVPHCSTWNKTTDNAGTGRIKIKMKIKIKIRNEIKSKITSKIRTAERHRQF
jgi:hypothetical protein